MNDLRNLSPLDVITKRHASAGNNYAEAAKQAIIGERLRQARVAASLTQQELARATFSKGYISAVERGRVIPSVQALRTLAERLGRPISYFLGEDEASLTARVGSGSDASASSDEERQQRETDARRMLEEAEGWLEKNQPERALEALHVEAQEPPDGLPLHEQPRWYWMVGWAFIRDRKFADALGWLERGQRLLESGRPRVPAAQQGRLSELAERIRNHQGGCYYELGQPATALRFHLECLRAITDGVVTDPELKLLIYKSLGNDHLMLAHHEEAINLFKRACVLSRDMNNRRQEGLSYWGLGLAYKSSDDLFHAQHAFREAVQIFERQDNMQLASPLHAMLGEVLTQLAEYEQAEKHLRLALKASERINNAYARRVALGNFARMYLAKGNTEEAITTAQEGLRALAPGQDRRTEGQIYQTLAEAYEARGAFAQAEEAYQKALNVLTPIEDGEFIGRVRERYGQFLAAQARFEEAYKQVNFA
jgi:tetratricopeptide (TPR) repeat protein